MFDFKVIKRCIRCRKPVREDGTCQNEKCVRFVPEKTAETVVKPTESTTESTSAEN